MKSKLKFALLAIPLLGLGLVSCQKTDPATLPEHEISLNEKVVIPGDNSGINARSMQESKYNTFYGPVVQFGEGRVRSWANISHEGKPLAIGIEFTEGALHHSHSGEGEESHGSEALLTLHQKAKAVMPFDHLTMGFVPAGHPPPGIYTVPHFDFHFYKMPLAERLAIPPYPQAMAAFDNNPPMGYIPPGYVRGPGGEPQMGAHWVDVLSPEFMGQPFTHTFIYGSYDGEVTFLEPMVTLEFLMSGTTVHKEIRQPQYVDPMNTYYPTRYSIWKNPDNNRYYISLNEMVWR